MVAVSALQPYARNARTHSRRQIKKIAASIERFGFVNPVLIDENNQIIAGHGRVAAAKLLGWQEVPTLRIEHLNETEKRAYILADNRLAEEAGWDKEMLAIRPAMPRGALHPGPEIIQRPARAGIPLPRQGCPGHSLRAHLHAPQKDQYLNCHGRPKARHQGNRRRNLWLAVQAVSSEPVSAIFPVKQGKNREFSRIWPIWRKYQWNQFVKSVG